MLFLHPIADLYGSDRMLLESVRATVEHGLRVTVVVPGDGPLVERLRATGAEVAFREMLVLRKALLTPAGLLQLLRGVAKIPSLVSWLRRLRPDLVYVNTITIPLWLLAARVSGLPVVSHVHEAERDVPRPVRLLMELPLVAAHRVIANSTATAKLLHEDLRPARRRIVVVMNGVAEPPRVPPPLGERGEQLRIVLVGRVSPRKGTDVAIAALRELRERGVPATLELVGDVFSGYEWYRERIEADIAGAGMSDVVRLTGFTSDVWSRYADADVVVVPSTRPESFGNVAVEGMLAGRLVVAAAVQGLEDIIRSGEDGILVAPGDPLVLAEALQTAFDDWPRTCALAQAGRRRALQDFGLDRYRREITAVLDEMLRSRSRGRRGRRQERSRRQG